MSKPITAKRFLELCNKWQVKTIATHSNWATHNRNSKGEWDDLNGVMWHHTGAFSSVNSMAELLWNGYDGLPGPLCQAGIDPAGYLRLTGWGRANHAGLGSSDTLKAVKSSTYPKTGNIRPSKADTDGNRHFYGFEFIADGKTPITEAQRITAVRITAALCLEHNWKADVIGHGEWQQGKWDLGAHGKMIDFSQARSWVAQAMKEGPPEKLPTRPVPPKPLPTPTTQIITVVKGDTLSGIAKKYGVELAKLINDNPAILQVGDKLKVPKK